VHRELGGQVPDDFLHSQLARLHEEGRPASERRVRELLLLEAVAGAREIEVSDDDVNARLDELAAAQGMSIRDMRRIARERGLAEALRAELREERALDYLCSQAKVDETTDT
jgi:trigger factor